MNSKLQQFPFAIFIANPYPMIQQTELWGRKTSHHSVFFRTIRLVISKGRSSEVTFAENIESIEKNFDIKFSKNLKIGAKKESCNVCDSENENVRGADFLKMVNIHKVKVIFLVKFVIYIVFELKRGTPVFRKSVK